MIKHMFLVLCVNIRFIKHMYDVCMFKNIFMHLTYMYILLGMFTVKPRYLCMKNFMNYNPIFIQLLKELPR